MTNFKLGQLCDNELKYFCFIHSRHFLLNCLYIFILFLIEQLLLDTRVCHCNSENKS